MHINKQTNESLIRKKKKHTQRVSQKKEYFLVEHTGNPFEKKGEDYEIFRHIDALKQQITRRHKSSATAYITTLPSGC